MHYRGCVTLFVKGKPFRINDHQLNYKMAPFCCLRPYLSIETVFLSSVTTDGGDEHGLKREKVGLMFSEYACTYQQVSENTKYL